MSVRERNRERKRMGCEREREIKEERKCLGEKVEKIKKGKKIEMKESGVSERERERETTGERERRGERERE